MSRAHIELAAALHAEYISIFIPVTYLNYENKRLEVQKVKRAWKVKVELYTHVQAPGYRLPYVYLVSMATVPATQRRNRIEV
jgi:hypothetical protein